MMKWLWLVLFMLTLTACGGGGRAVAPVGKEVEKPARHTGATPTYYTVTKGDTLYSISWRFGLDYKQVAAYNDIRAPFTIYSGQKLRLKPSKSTSSNTTKAPTSTSKPKTTTSKSTTTKTNKSEPVFVGSQHLKWHWPTQGKLISTYSSSQPGRKGIEIAGKQGQSVISAASGKVVYSGNGLPRYGNLLIIKHNDVYLSAYAHNDKLLVKEGAIVKAGQKVATLGSTGTQSNKLHFEIRRNGKPVDPLRFLPKR